MEGGEWSNFSQVVCVNGEDEADFMAQLFPNSNNFGVHYSNHNNNANCYQETSYRNPNVVGYYQMDHHANLAASAGNASAMAIDFLQGHMEDENEVKEGADEGDNLDESKAPADDAVEDIKSSDSSENFRKRLKLSDIPKEKRNVKAKKNPKLTLGSGDNDEEENEARVNRQSSSSGSLEDDCSSKGANTNGKTRVSRGSATDPQSLYARKRREKINERLKILQTLVPNGTKVDISTMLEEAVHYVKFLQLQIKLLSSDELWMYAPIAYNGMNLGLDFNNISIPR